MTQLMLHARVVPHWKKKIARGLGCIHPAIVLEFHLSRYKYTFPSMGSIVIKICGIERRVGSFSDAYGNIVTEIK